MRHISLKTKVVLPVTLMIVVAMLLALVIVNQVVRQQVEKRIAQDVENARLVFNELEMMEREVLIDRGRVAVNAPYLKAAVDTGDSTTVQKVADGLFENIHKGPFVVLDHRYRVLARNAMECSGGIFRPDSVIIPVSVDSGDRRSGILLLGGRFYHGTLVPIHTQDSVYGNYLLGSVLLANLLDAEYLARLKDLVDAEITLIHDSNVIETTLKHVLDEPFSQENQGEVLTYRISGEEYLGVTAGADNTFLLMRSIDSELRAIMQPIQSTLIFVGIFCVMVAVLIRFYISREIVNPLKKLDVATDAFSEGEYGHPLEVSSHDEIGQLAAKFESMREALRHRMHQLEERNSELESALQQLESTQKDLIQAEKLAATGKITAQLSHELNNPIHNIRGCLEAAQRKITSNEDGVEFIELAHKEVQRIAALIHQMLNFYRPQITNIAAFNVNTVIEEVLKTMGCRFSEQNITVDLVLDPDLPQVKSAADQLKQVLLNLISNAQDAMPDGGDLTIVTEQKPDNIYIEVSDSGCGIANEHIDKIFDAFFTTKDQASGVGLGLSVSYGIMNSLGGSIAVESEEGMGTKFQLELPL